MHIDQNTTVANAYAQIRKIADVESKGCPCKWCDTVDHLLRVAAKEFEWLGQRWKAQDIMRISIS